MGWTSDRLSPLSELFIAHCAASLDGPVLDIGAGFGAASIAALRAGATVVANDLDEGQLADIVHRANPDRDRLRTVAARFPRDLRFDAETFSAIHVSNMFHFLNGNQLQRGLLSIAHWLRPGGKLFVQAATPYLGPFAAFIAEYQRRVDAGDPWPGWVARTRDWSEHRLLNQMPSAIHLLDDAVLRRAATGAGLAVERAWMYTRPGLERTLRLDGRETAALIAAKPPPKLSSLRGNPV